MYIFYKKRKLLYFHEKNRQIFEVTNQLKKDYVNIIKIIVI